MDYVQLFMFCYLAHSDLNFHFKKFNTSGTSLALSEPHQSKHILSTLSLDGIWWIDGAC